MSVLYHFHLFDAFLHIFGEMRERRILTKLSTHFSKKVPKICARFLAKTCSQKKKWTLCILIYEIKIVTNILMGFKI